MKRSFLMLAHKYDPLKHNVDGWYASEKLDGIRAFWDGGISKGVASKDVPWSNVEKNHRLLVEPIATGLWSRYGNVIHAPDEWVSMLPKFPLDGELWSSKGSWQTISSIVKKHAAKADKELWKDIQYYAFDSPSLRSVFADGTINETNFKKTLNQKEILQWIGNKDIHGPIMFEHMIHRLMDRTVPNDVYQIHCQQKLANGKEEIERLLDDIVKTGGEGVMLRSPYSIWKPERSHQLLKYKPYHDDEGVVVGYIFGRKTELGSKLLGKMGALILDYKGKRLELSGFTDVERMIVGPNLESDSVMYEGKEAGNEYTCPMFPRGTVVTFKYRELSDSGIPKESRYFRKHI